MREINDDFYDGSFNSDLQKEIGGQPIFYSTCDSNLLVYSGKYTTIFLIYFYWYF